MSFLLSKLDELEERTVDGFYSNQLSPKERLELEERLGCSVTQIKSRIEGFVTFLEKKDFKAGMGIGVLGDVRKGTMRRIPYVAVGYLPRLIMTKAPQEFLMSVDLLEGYLQGLSKKSEVAASVPIRILEEAKIAANLGKKFDWDSFSRKSYEFPNGLYVHSNVSDSGLSLTAYSPKEKRKDGIKILIGAAKEFEKSFGIEPL